MRDRLAAVKELRKEFGDDVPAERLEGVGFIRHDQEDGVVSFVSVERLAQLALSESEVKNHETLPEITLEMKLPTSSKIDAKVDRATMLRRMSHLSRSLYAGYFNTHDPEWVSDTFDQNSPFFDVFHRYNQIISYQEEHFIPVMHIASGLDIASFLTRACFEETYTMMTGRSEDTIDDFFELPVDFTDDEEDPLPGDFLTPAESEQLLAKLQTLRSIFSDTPEFYRIYDRELSYPYDLELGQIDASPEKTEFGIGLQLSVLCGVLKENGFIEAASKLNSARSFGEARELINSELVDNEAKRDFKKREKEWQEKRKTVTSEAEIHSLYVERTALKEELKTKLRPLQGVDIFLNLPREYSRSSLAKIKDVEQLLLVKATDGKTTYELDTKADAIVDKNAGVVSGDCTVGEGLAFNASTGLRNVKVRKNGLHIGNIYLLQTTASGSDKKVWHIDAVQIPDRTIDWSEFPEVLIDTFSKLAEQNDVDMLTINASQHHVSNYDYISRGFMEYLGTAENWKGHSVMDLLEDASDITDDSSKITVVDTSRYATHSADAKELQAMHDRQVIIWQSNK